MNRLKKAVTGKSSKSSATDANVPDNHVVHGDGFADAPEVLLMAQMLLHIDAHEEGGLGFTNKALLDQQRGAIVEVAKEAGKKLLTGNFNLINLSMPVKMSEPRSYLQKLTDVWVYPRLLNQAVDATDPVERLRWVSTWFTAGLQHVFQSWKKPFNPILGETWQAVQGGGSAIFLEQISHHPPISAFQMIGPGGCYNFTGHSQPDVQYKANAVKTSAKGYRSIWFRNGNTTIDIAYPAYYMRGILYSAMPRGDMQGTVMFTDRTNRLCCEIQFGEIKEADDPLLRRPDTIEGLIFSLPPEWRRGEPVPTVLANARSARGGGGLLSRIGSGSGGSGTSQRSAIAGMQHVRAGCTGNWLSHIDWDGARYWTLVEEQPDLWTPVPDPLPSDARFRLDLDTLLTGDLIAAQAAKEALEQRQRADAKLRKEGGCAHGH